MQQFIPYSFENTASKWYDNRPLFSYGYNTMGVIGARSIGKTYTTKRYVIKRFLHTGEKFVWIRDNDEARKKLTLDNGAKFFSDIKKTFGKNFEASIKGEIITINGKTAGYLMSASIFQNYKGDDFNEIKTIVYDEFIEEKGRSKNAYQGYQFVNILYTIARTRNDVKLILLANALDRGSEILEILGIKINQGFGFYINKEKGVILHYCDNNPKFNKDRDNSIAGKIIKGTVYEDNLFHNKFVDDESEYFEKKPDKLRLYVIIHNQYNSARIYIGDGKFYVCNDFNPEAHANVRYCNNIEDVNSRIQLIPKYILEPLVNGYNKSLFKFENANLKKIFMNFIKKY